MKKNNSNQPIPTLTTSIEVDNYDVESFILFMSQYGGAKNAPQTLDAPAVMQVKGLPYELALLIQRRVIHAFTSQEAYNRLLHLLQA